MLPALSRLSRNQDGMTAIEFAFTAPILLLLLVGIMGYGYVLGVYHSIQQIASEAARSSIAGLNDGERSRIARDFITAHAGSYAFIDPAKLRIRTSQTGPLMLGFEVAVAYDMSGSVYDSLSRLASLPQPVIERRAIIQRGEN
ncbi:TadE/TadG family type IV pilus assembly protein [Bosea sp. (in: a-proteobacteria)]|uniref:TadE/TadG family type IV pilus assembly protein n=1 Tax=Bosea sp. (in: a-proteobacteria) TaxID=1871050 RepID=UPI00261632FB|nr:TadE/TadG family type IV pilus assembly protein [Bosea sp. (in: a-proteobacteria)]MCO5091789.1 pilus assembly protein [Bosea sp. (in: a-proteobacteria)]